MAAGLVLALVAASAFAQQSSSPSLSTLKGQLEQAARAGDTAKALQLAGQIVEITEPEHVEALYGAGTGSGCAALRSRTRRPVDRRDQRSSPHPPQPGQR